MNILLLGLSLISFEAFRAENKVMSTVTEDPPYTVHGPLVSVIIPAYNEEKYLPLLLQALDNQTYQNIEVIVVDNESTDDTVRVAEDYGAKVIVNKEYNLSKSRNMGAKEAKGEILVFIDADSIPQHEVIEKVSKEIAINGKVFVTVNKCSTDSHLQSTMRVVAGWVPGDLARYTFSGMFIAVSKQAFNSVGGFDEALLPQDGKGEDVDFVQRITTMYPSSVSYLRTLYCGTSARRQKKEGYIVQQHWGDRAIRGYLEWDSD